MNQPQGTAALLYPFYQQLGFYAWSIVLSPFLASQLVLSHLVPIPFLPTSNSWSLLCIQQVFEMKEVINYLGLYKGI